ncbi:MAG: hypothetical protein WC495_04995 [Patescibacteria group bacterium]
MSKEEKTKILNKLRLYFILHPGSKERWINSDIFCQICKFNEAPVGYTPSCPNSVRLLVRGDLKDVIEMAAIAHIENDEIFYCADWIKND